MKKKNEVYVVVDTPKKAKKLAKVLDMFGESVFDEYSISAAYQNGWVIKLLDTGVWGSGTYTDGLYQLTIKELRNILAVEHLKEGDVVVFGIEGSSGKYIGKYDSFINNFFSAYYKPLDSKESLTDHTGCFDTFIRYATEEEKALLNPHGEPKPELEVGRWYKGNGDKLIFTTSEEQDGHVKAYGLGAMGEWFEDDNRFSWTTDDLKEATPQEVEQALIKEAKKRYKVGDKVSRLDDFFYGGSSNILGNINVSTDWHDGIRLCIKSDDSYWHMVFKDGKWAEVVKQAPKFEVKIDGESLKQVVERINESLNTDIGSYTTDVKITDEDIAVVERLHGCLLDNHGYNLDASMLKNARALTHKLRQLI